MTLKNTAGPVLVITSVITAGYLAITVLHDPAVQGAWREAGEDCSAAANSARTAVPTIRKAAKSLGKATRDTAACWRRNRDTSHPLVETAMGPMITPRLSAGRVCQEREVPSREHGRCGGAGMNTDF